MSNNKWVTVRQLGIIGEIIVISTILIVLGIAWFCLGIIIELIKRNKEKKINNFMLA